VRSLMRPLMVLALVVFGAVPATARTVDRYETARQLIRETIAKKTLQSVSVAVFREGRIDWEEGFGIADREKGTRATPRTAYSLASISKPLTATALMTLVEAGKVDLDKPVNDYLGPAKLVARVGDVREATVRRLADHTSGLVAHVQFFYPDTAFRPASGDETIRRFGQIISRPGERFSYSNLGYGILGDVIAHASGMSYEAYMREAVFMPLGLEDTAVGPPVRKGLVVAPRYGASGQLVPNYMTDHAGASDIYSSAHDMIRFAAFHLKERERKQRAILSDAAIDRMHVNSSRPGGQEGYGIGFDTERRGGREVVTHGGSMPGVSTQMTLFPDKGIAIVVLSNSLSTSAVGKIADTIAAGVLPALPSKLDSPSAPATAWPTGLTGKWAGHIARRDEADWPVAISIADGSVEAAFDGDRPVRLQDASFAEGRLTGTFAVPLVASDTARYNSTMRLDVKLEGDRLYGGVMAIDDVTSSGFAAGLTYWIDLARVPSAGE